MIRGLVKDHKVCVGGCQASQRRAVALAAAETADLLKNHVAGDAEAGEHITALLFDEFLVARSDSVKHLHLFIEAGQHLVEVAGLDATSKDDAPRVGLQLAEQAAEAR